MSRAMLLELWGAGVQAVDPAATVQAAIPDDVLHAQRVIAIAFGKAASGMLAGLTAALGREPDAGVVVVPHGTSVAGSLPVMFAGHPLPDEGSVAAGEEALRLAGSATRDDVVVALVSGGGSALLAAPTVPLAELRQETERLLLAGADIGRLNDYRRSVSRIKAGGLAATCTQARLVTLLMSDVPGDSPDLIASGPTMGAHPRHTWRIVATAKMAADAVVAAAHRVDLTGAAIPTRLCGEARAVARAVTRLPQHVDVAVFAGETTVTVRGDGCGGRNQEAALAAAIEIVGSGRIFLAAGTDGQDGPTPAAGGLVDGGTIGRGVAAGRDPTGDLRRNDSYAFLGAAGDLVVTGPTGTNVGDVWLLTR